MHVKPPLSELREGNLSNNSISHVGQKERPSRYLDDTVIEQLFRERGVGRP
jgi:hypothetical protein